MERELSGAAERLAEASQRVHGEAQDGWEVHERGASWEGDEARRCRTDEALAREWAEAAASAPPLGDTALLSALLDAIAPDLEAHGLEPTRTEPDEEDGAFLVDALVPVLTAEQALSARGLTRAARRVALARHALGVLGVAMWSRAGSDARASGAAAGALQLLGRGWPFEVEAVRPPTVRPASAPGLPELDAALSAWDARATLTLPGLGRFSPRVARAFRGHNPVNGQPMVVPARASVTFVGTEELFAFLNDPAAPAPTGEWGPLAAELAAAVAKGPVALPRAGTFDRATVGTGETLVRFRASSAVSDRAIAADEADRDPE
jgi:hypothetical protein